MPRPSSSSSAAGSSAKTSVTSPLGVASSAGISSSGWLKVGDGLWRGWIALPNGIELEIEELKASWRCLNDETSAPSLEQLLAKLLKKHAATR